MSTSMSTPTTQRELAIEGDSGKFLRSDIALFVIPGIACFISCALTFRLVYLHLKNYHMASRQRYIIRIILMVPIYAVDSWLSLIFIHDSLYFDVPRDIYESYVIYNFMALCIDYMGGDEAADAWLARQPPLRHGFPFCRLGYHTMPDFLGTCKIMILQYRCVLMRRRCCPTQPPPLLSPPPLVLPRFSPCPLLHTTTTHAA